MANTKNKNSMTIIEAIRQRKSVRSFTGKPITDEQAEKIAQFIGKLQSPFAKKMPRIELIRAQQTVQTPVKLGTYGVIANATDFLTLIYEDGVLAEENAGYLFEQVVLYCTSLGLGTCWLGGTFKRNDFRKQLNIQPQEKFRIVSPVGTPQDKTRFINLLLGHNSKHLARKPFSTLFFDEYFDNGLTEANAGKFREPLEMVRIAPSANNSQPWRVILHDTMLHFYHISSTLGGFSRIDLGIALCHFDLTCKELGINGRWEVLLNISGIRKEKYAISYQIL